MVTTRLVGRGDELSALLAHCASEPPGAVLLTGEAGVGKTRLLDELAVSGGPGRSCCEAAPSRAADRTARSCGHWSGPPRPRSPDHPHSPRTPPCSPACSPGGRRPHPRRWRISSTPRSCSARPSACSCR